MSLHAHSVNDNFRADITELMGGEMPREEQMNNTHVFVYSCDGTTPPVIMTNAEFYKNYRWRDTWNNDNTVEKI